jgi:hypothetical protein
VNSSWPSPVRRIFAATFAMRSILSLLLASSITVISAQPFNWQWSVHDTATLSSPTIHGFATDALGNSYVAGQFFGSVSFGGLPAITSVGASDVFVVKYDNQGVALWAVRAGGADFDNPYDLALDGNGSVFITGAFESATAAFGGTTLTLIGQMDVFVAKLSAVDGSFQWAKRYGGNDFQANAREWGKAIACDADGDVYVSGCFDDYFTVPGLAQLQGCSQYYDDFLLKLDTDGNGIWSRRPDCGQQWIYSAGEGQVLHVGADNMLYAGWRIRGDTIFYETDTLLNSWNGAGTHEGVVAKYDLNGNYLWSRVIGGYGYDDVKALQADADGHLYIAMHRETDYNLGIVGIEVAGSLGHYKNVILKTDADGHFIWGTRIGNSSYDHDIEAMLLESAEALLVAGWYRGPFEIGGTVPDNGTIGQYGHYLARFDSSNALLDIETSRFTYPRGVGGVGLDEGGNIYIGGFFQDSLSFPGLPVMDLANASNGAMFLARSGDFNTGTLARTGTGHAIAFPVPTLGGLTIASDQEFDAIVISDALGREVQTVKLRPARSHALAVTAKGPLQYSLLRNGRMVGQGSILAITQE